VEAVRTGRAQEFAPFAPSGDVPDPDAQTTFAAARLDRTLRHHGAHRQQWALHRALIGLRRTNPALGRSPRASARASAAARVITLVRTDARDAVVALFNVSAEPAAVMLPSPP